MISRLFWIVGMLLLAVIIHLSYTLFGPRVAMGGIEAQAAQFAGGFNRMAVLDPQEQAALLEGTGPASVTAVCAYDLSQGDVTLRARMGSGPWTLTLHSARGINIYALNDAQAGAEQVTVTIKRISNLAALFGGDEEAGAINDGWRVETAETRGLAVLWTPLADAALKARIEADLRASSCATAR